MNKMWLSLLGVSLCVAISMAQENLFVTTGSPDQISPGITCTKLDATSTTYTVMLNIYESDLEFKDDDGNPFNFTCTVLDVAQLQMNMLEFATNTTCTDTNNVFALVQDRSNVAADDIDVTQQRTHFHTESNFTTAAMPCGGLSEGGLLKFAAYCTMEENFNHQQTRTITFEVAETSCISVEQIADGITVENPSNTSLTRRYDVGCKVYSIDQRNLTDLNNMFEESEAANEVTSAVPLGSSLYVECCVGIADADPRKYFIDGVSVLGMNLRNCQARIDPLKADDYLGTINPVNVVDAEGCGTASSPFAAWETDSYQFKFGRGDASADSMLWIQSPNCFRSDVFEAVSFARKDPTAESEVILECDVNYCVRSDDTSCFGPDAGMPGDMGKYDGACGGLAGRKRRNAEDDQIPAELPRTTRFSYTVIENTIITEQSVQPRDSSSGCFTQPTFIGLSAALGALLAIILCIDACLAIKLMSRSSKRSHSSSGSDSGSRSISSEKGFSNKGYYN